MNRTLGLRCLDRCHNRDASTAGRLRRQLAPLLARTRAEKSHLLRTVLALIIHLPFSPVPCPPSFLLQYDASSTSLSPLFLSPSSCNLIRSTFFSPAVLGVGSPRTSFGQTFGPSAERPTANDAAANNQKGQRARAAGAGPSCCATSTATATATASWSLVAGAVVALASPWRSRSCPWRRLEAPQQRRKAPGSAWVEARAGVASASPLRSRSCPRRRLEAPPQRRQAPGTLAEPTRTRPPTAWTLTRATRTCRVAASTRTARAYAVSTRARPQAVSTRAPVAIV